jgi:hypothetical protein
MKKHNQKKLSKWEFVGVGAKDQTKSFKRRIRIQNVLGKVGSMRIRKQRGITVVICLLQCLNASVFSS